MLRPPGTARSRTRRPRDPPRKNPGTDKNHHQTNDSRCFSIPSVLDCTIDAFETSDDRDGRFGCCFLFMPQLLPLPLLVGVNNCVASVYGLIQHTPEGSNGLLKASGCERERTPDHTWTTFCQTFPPPPVFQRWGRENTIAGRSPPPPNTTYDMYAVGKSFSPTRYLTALDDHMYLFL